MEHLIQVMGESFFDYKFLFHSLQTHEKPDVASHADPSTVLIVLGDNSGEHFVEHFRDFRVVFKVHLPGSCEHVHPVPLGYTRMQLYGSTQPAANRAHNIFYSGNINAHRVDLWRALAWKHPWPQQNIKSRLIRRGIVFAIRKLKLNHDFSHVFEDSNILFTSGFAQGFGAGDYSRLLAESKICLAPFGFGRAECFRHFEAMRAGSIVISDELPETWYLAGSPIIQIARWSSLRQVVHSLLADAKRMQEIQAATIDWWNKKCSPAAVARHMAGVIASSVTPEERLANKSQKEPTCVKKHRKYH